MTHDDAVAAIASVVEQYPEIVLRVGKVTQYYSSTQEMNANNLLPIEEAIIKSVLALLLSILKTRPFEQHRGGQNTGDQVVAIGRSIDSFVCFHGLAKVESSATRTNNVVVVIGFCN